MQWYKLILLVSAVVFAGCGGASGPKSVPVTISQAKATAAHDDATSKRQVIMRGVVTYAKSDVLFLQDQTGGIKRSVASDDNAP